MLLYSQNFLKMQIPEKFPDLRTAGQALADTLQPFRGAQDTVVLGLVRGGVPLAVEVAAALGLPLDLAVFRTFFLRPKGSRIRAGRFAGVLVVDDELQRWTGPAVEETHLWEGLAALEERERTCRGDHPAMPLAGKTLLLIDNGMRTGGTIRDAIRLVRKLEPARIVAAVPIAAADALRTTEAHADEMVCLRTASQLGNVAVAYERFDVPSEERIREMLG
jgi:putative phosphoribosyl transferase